MASFDFGQKISSGHLIPPQAWNGGTALTSAAVDLQGFEGVAVLVYTGAVTAGANLEIAFHQGDADNFTPGAGNLIPESRIIQSPAMDDTANATYIHSIVPGNHRYLKVVISREGTDAAAVSASAILGHAVNIPT